MRWRDLSGLAIESARAHRLRATLTVLAVAIGATAVLLITALGDAAKEYVISQFASVGTNLVSILPGRVETSGIGSVLTGGVRNLTIEDCEDIQRRVPGIRRVVPVSLGSAPFAWGGRRRDVFVIGTTSADREIRNLTVTAGSFLPSGDPRRGERVVVIGPKLKHEVFGGANALGKTVRIASTSFRVIGVLGVKGQTMGVDMDDIALIPVATGLRLFNQSSLFRVTVDVSDAASIPAVIDRMKSVLIDRHRDEDFTVVTQDAMLRAFRSILGALTAALAGIAAISLGVAGIGIMNVMLVSVSERVAEVGLLKALGGTPPQIASLFLVEALLLSGLGALAGLGLGLAVERVAALLLPSVPLRPSIAWVASILFLCLSIGGVFGLMPARRAAAMPAAEALRGKR